MSTPTEIIEQIRLHSEHRKDMDEEDWQRINGKLYNQLVAVDPESARALKLAKKEAADIARIIRKRNEREEAAQALWSP